jgi:uncharacterized membrane protein
MELSDEQKFEILVAELNLLQARFTNYDVMMWRSRSWALALVSAMAGWSLSLDGGADSGKPQLLLFASIVALLFWLMEGTFRAKYVWKYATRYRRLRSALNGTEEDLGSLSLYDLTDHLGNTRPFWIRLRQGLLRIEMLVFFLALALVPIVISLLAP